MTQTITVERMQGESESSVIFFPRRMSILSESVRWRTRREENLKNFPDTISRLVDPSRRNGKFIDYIATSTRPTLYLIGHQQRFITRGGAAPDTQVLFMMAGNTFSCGTRRQELLFRHHHKLRTHTHTRTFTTFSTRISIPPNSPPTQEGRSTWQEKESISGLAYIS